MTTLSTIIRFKFKGNTFAVDVEPKISTRYRPDIDIEVTQTVIAMINSLFHTTNLSLQKQIKKMKLKYKTFLLLFLMFVFISIIVYFLFENNRTSTEFRYTEIDMQNNLIYLITYISLATLSFISLYLYFTFNRLYKTLILQWRNECIRNLAQSSARWSMQFPVLQFETKYPGFMYNGLLKKSIKSAIKGFKANKKLTVKEKKKKLKSPRMKSPRLPVLSGVTSPVKKYSKLENEDGEHEYVNTCRLAVCCCCVKDNWGFIKIYYQYNKHTNNDQIKYALQELQQANCIVDEYEECRNNVQIIKMIQSPEQQQHNLNPNMLKQVAVDRSIEISVHDVDLAIAEGRNDI